MTHDDAVARIVAIGIDDAAAVRDHVSAVSTTFAADEDLRQQIEK